VPPSNIFIFPYAAIVSLSFPSTFLGPYLFSLFSKVHLSPLLLSFPRLLIVFTCNRYVFSRVTLSFIAPLYFFTGRPIGDFVFFFFFCRVCVVLVCPFVFLFLWWFFGFFPLFFSFPASFSQEVDLLPLLFPLAQLYMDQCEARTTSPVVPGSRLSSLPFLFFLVFGN